MTASKPSTDRNRIDWAKVDAYDNTPEDYQELPELTDEMLARAVHRVNGVAVPAPARGRPPLGERSKLRITLRLDPDVIEHFRARGPGWQGMINTALREAAKLK